MNFLEKSYWNKFGLRVDSKIDKLINYYKRIILLGNRNLKIFERHHMVPKSFNTPECFLKKNIIALTPREHYEVHKILTECFTGEFHKKMIYAFHFMTYCNREYYITAEEYEFERIEFHNIISLNTGSDNPFYGKSHSKQSINKMKLAHSNGKFINNGYSELYIKEEEDLLYYLSIGYNLGRCSSSIKDKICVNKDGKHKYINRNMLSEYINNGWSRGYTKDRVSNVTNKLIGRKLSVNHKDNISKSLLGSNNPFYGKNHSDISKEKMSSSHKGQIVWQKNIKVVSNNIETIMKARDICKIYNITYSDIKNYIDTGKYINNILLYN